MRAFAVSALLLMVNCLAPLRAAEPPRLAVFDLEMIDTSLDDPTRGLRADDRARLQRTGDQFRKELGESGKFQIVDIAPVNVAAHRSAGGETVGQVRRRAAARANADDRP